MKIRSRTIFTALFAAMAAGKATAQMPRATTATPDPGVLSNTAAIFIRGTVVVDDGSALPKGIAVSSICAGKERIVAYPRADGRFEFRWADNNLAQPDASQARLDQTTSTLGSAGVTTRPGTSVGGAHGDQITNCELGVSQPGYRSSTVNLFNHSSTSNPDVGTISLHRIGSDEGHFISTVALQAPKDAKKAWDDGMTSLQKNQRAEALASFQKAVKIFPEFADAWTRIGILQVQLKQTEPGQSEPGKSAFEKAMTLDSKLIVPWQELGFLASAKADWPETARYLDEAVKLDPTGSSKAWYLDATAHYNLKHYDEAEIGIRKAIELDTKHQNPRGQFLLGLVLIAKEDYKGGSDALRAYMEASPNAGDLDVVRGELERVQALIK
jgi:Flp pilus assembly protein TadD